MPGLEPPTVFQALDVGVIPQQPEGEVLREPEGLVRSEGGEGDADIAGGIEGPHPLELPRGATQGAEPFEHEPLGIVGVGIALDPGPPVQGHPELEAR
jgi:hypothetical protein